MAAELTRVLIAVRAWDLIWLQAHPHPVFLLSGLAERVLVATWWLWQALQLG